MDDRFSVRELLEELGERLKLERLDRNLTVEVVSRQSGVSERTVRNVEDGQPFSMTTLLALLRTYGLIGRLEALLPERGPSPIQLADRNGEPRRRASRRGGEEWDW